jgi:hypothetical protein
MKTIISSDVTELVCRKSAEVYTEHTASVLMVEE